MMAARLWRNLSYLWIVGALLIPFPFNGRADSPVGEQPARAEAGPALERRWGVRVEGIVLAAADHVLIFRYRVVDPDKASQLMRRTDEPFFVHQASGTKVPVFRAAKVGRMQQTGTRPQAQKVYTIMFSNPGKIVKRGDKVSVIIGDYEAKDLTVQ